MIGPLLVYTVSVLAASVAMLGWLYLRERARGDATAEDGAWIALRLCDELERVAGDLTSVSQRAFVGFGPAQPQSIAEGLAWSASDAEAVAYIVRHAIETGEPPAPALRRAG